MQISFKSKGVEVLVSESKIITTRGYESMVDQKVTLKTENGALEISAVSLIELAEALGEYLDSKNELELI